MSKMAFWLLAACLSVGDSAYPDEAKMEDVKFVVNEQYDLGFNFETQSAQFILPKFEHEADAYALNAEWRRGISEGHFSKGLNLFCDCKGAYATINGRKVFNVNQARFYFAKFSGW